MPKGLIEWEYIDRMALYVDDMNAAVKDFEQIFGIAPWVVLNLDAFNSKAGLSDGHIELVSPRKPGGELPTIGGNFSGPIVALGFKVKDIEAAKKVMGDRGIDLYMGVEVETPGGMKECMLTRTKAFGGIPLSLEQYEGDSFLNAVEQNLADDPEGYEERAKINQEGM